MTTPQERLAPVAEALLAAARQDAARTIASARTESEQRLGAAEKTVAGIRRDARSRGVTDGRRQAASEARRSRRRDQQAVLEAEHRAYAELRRQVRARLDAMRGDPAYPAWRDALARRAVAALGPGARVVEAPEGGIVAEAGGRRLDLTVPALAELALESLGTDLEGLWR